MGRIIIVSHYYPPFGGVGGYRMKYLFEHLKNQGKDVLLITPFAKGPRIINYSKTDPGEGRNFPVKIRRVLLFFNRLFFPVDNKILTAIPLFFHIYKLLRRDDTIVVSLPPVSIAIAGVLAGKIKKSKIVTDFRDSINKGFITNWHFLDGFLERYIVNSSDVNVVATPMMEMILRKRYPNIVIKNIFTGAEDIPELVEVKKKERYKIVYTGSIRKFNIVDVFLSEFCSLPDIIKNKFKIEIYGQDLEVGLNVLINRKGCNNVFYKGAVTRVDSLRIQKEADLLLLPIRNEKGLIEAIPYKFYEYLKAGKPILFYTTKANYISQLASKRGILIEPGKGNMLNKLNDFPDNISKGNLKEFLLKENMVKWEKILSY